jgi:hypothetical protein
MDLVVNHSSDEHKWFQESKKSETIHIETITTGGRQRKAHLHFPEVLKQMVAAGDMTKRRILTYIILAISNQI